MAKVTMVLPMSGVRDGVPWPAPGETLEVGDDEAAQLVASGVAVAAKSKSKSAEVETATKDGDTETAVPKTTRRTKTAAKKPAG